MSSNEVLTGNRQMSHALLNAKQILQAGGAGVESAGKHEAGQLAHLLDSLLGYKKGQYMSLDHGKKIWHHAIAQMTFPAKVGQLIPRASGFGTSADGVIDQSTTSGTVAFAAFDTTHGESMTFTTTAVGGSTGGYNHARLHTLRTFRPMMFIKFKTSVSTNLRQFIGWKNSTALVGNTDDPLNALAGFGIGKQTTSGNFRVLHNDGVGATISDDTGIPWDTNPHILKMWADGNTSQWFWAIDDSVPVAVTSEIPVAQSLSVERTMITTAAAGIILSVYNEFYATY